jgi:uncharacterized protein YdhG (YjbR/CyaY superfamily)
MDAQATSPQDIDTYISGFPEPIQERLQAVRAAVRAAAPGAEERISYGMPAFAMGEILVYFAAFKRHLGLYPRPSAIAHFKEELAGFKGAKGSVQFPLDRPLPLDLIRRIVEFRVAESRIRPRRTSSQPTTPRRNP